MTGLHAFWGWPAPEQDMLDLKRFAPPGLAACNRGSSQCQKASSTELKWMSNGMLLYPSMHARELLLRRIMLMLFSIHCQPLPQHAWLA